MKTHKRKLCILLLFSLSVLIFNKCLNEQKQGNDLRGPDYAGSPKCITCHREIYESYQKTAHNLSSRPASKETIKGSFATDSNTFYYRPELKIVMEQHDSGFYQVAYLNDVMKKTARFDIVTGSGRKGQSYLYWRNDNVYQLPVSYYIPEKSWVNSPNFPPHNVQFTRNIPIGCFECHSSYIQRTATKPIGDYLVDYFDKQKIVYGIDCERCHGPAAAHVDFHENNPLEKKSRYIESIAGLPRQEKLDMCAVCHSGARQTITSTFDFKPGSKLSDYFYPDTSSLNTSQIDVHGKQYQLLTASKCFLKSSTLTCSSCHNTHVEERNSMKAFSLRCVNCHATSNHDMLKMPDSVRASIVNNCIDCHMPARPSALITMQAQNRTKPIPALVRTHFIAVYPQETRKFISNK